VTIEELKRYLEVIPEIMRVALKLAIAVGAIAILVYCGIIGYYPYGIEIGDGLFFVWIALSFGFTYTLLAVFLLCTGIASLPVLKPLQWAALKIVGVWGKLTGKPSTLTPPKIATITSTYAPLALIGVIGLGLLIYAAVHDPETGLALLASAVVMGVGFSALLDMPGAHEEEQDREVVTAGRNNVRRVQFILVIALYFVPLLLGGILGNVLEQSFRMAGIRHEGVTLYVDKDFFELMKPAYSAGKDVETVGDLKKMQRVDVLFTGIGSSSVVRVPAEGSEIRRFIVPNDKFHIEY
jgi:hypothetical protein